MVWMVGMDYFLHLCFYVLGLYFTSFTLSFFLFIIYSFITISYPLPTNIKQSNYSPLLKTIFFDSIYLCYKYKPNIYKSSSFNNLFAISESNASFSIFIFSYNSEPDRNWFL